MKKLRLLTLSLLLTAALSITASAQQPPACNPGDTQSPPCSGAAQTLAGDNETGTVTGTVQDTNTVDLVTEVTMDLIETLLSIF